MPFLLTHSLLLALDVYCFNYAAPLLPWGLPSQVHLSLDLQCQSTPSLMREGSVLTKVLACVNHCTQLDALCVITILSPCANILSAHTCR